jgi:hypothetical protein
VDSVSFVLDGSGATAKEMQFGYAGSALVNQFDLAALYTDLDSRFAASSHNHSASAITSGELPILRGGTNATTATQARTNLGVTEYQFNSNTIDFGGNVVLVGGTNVTIGTALSDSSQIQYTISAASGTDTWVNGGSFYTDSSGAWTVGLQLTKSGSPTADINMGALDSRYVPASGGSFEDLQIDGITTYPLFDIRASSNTGRYMRIGMLDAVNHTVEAVGSGAYLTFHTASTERVRIANDGTSSFSGSITAIGSSNNVILKGTNTGDSASPLLRYRDSANTDLGYIGYGSTLHSNLIINNQATGSVNIFSGGTERAIFGGSYALDVKGNFRSTGTAYASEFEKTSDRRLKSNILQLTGYEFRNLNPVSFTKNDRHSFGFIAQEIKKYYPSLVTKGEDGYYTLAQDHIVAMNTAGLQKVDSKVYQLKKEVSHLKNESQEFKRRCRELEQEVQELRRAG